MRDGQLDGVWIDPARRSGEPCIGGTRVPVDMVVNHVWQRGVDSAMDTWCLDRAQVLHACWYAGAGFVTRLHGKGGQYVARRGPWRKRWADWARAVHGSLWHQNLDDIPDPPTEATP